MGFGHCTWALNEFIVQKKQMTHSDVHPCITCRSLLGEITLKISCVATLLVLQLFITLKTALCGGPRGQGTAQSFPPKLPTQRRLRKLLRLIIPWKYLLIIFFGKSSHIYRSNRLKYCYQHLTWTPIIGQKLQRNKSGQIRLS